MSSAAPPPASPGPASPGPTAAGLSASGPPDPRDRKRGAHERGPGQDTGGGRASWLAFLGEEWGLLLLAATMTFGSWWIVRESVVKTHVVNDIRVVLEVDTNVDDQIGAVLTMDPKTISANLRCSEREKNEAINALKRTGTRSVTLRILDLPTDESRPLEARRDVFDWPFDDSRILDKEELGMPAKGWVFRISPTNVLVERPKTVRSPEVFESETGLRADIEVQPKNLPLSVPQGVFDADHPLVPDPIAIDPSQFTRRQDGTYEGPLEVTLTFDKWRTSPTASPWLGVYKRELNLPRITALVSLVEVGQSSIKNRVLVLADQGRYEFDFRDLLAEKGVIGVIGSDALAFEGTLRGPKKVLDEMAKDESKRAWSWGIRLKQDLETEFKRNGPSDPKPDEEGWLSLDGEIIWLPTTARFRNRGIVHEQVGFEKEFTYKVRLRKKP